MRQEIADDEYDGDIEQVDPEDVDMRMMEEVEGWLTYKIIPVQDNFPLIGLKMMIIITMTMIPIVIVNNLSLPIL